MRVVIGGSKTSMQCFISLVGIRSREQVELEEDKIARRTSASVAGAKFARASGVEGGGGLRFRTVAGVSGANLAQRLVILSSKY